MEYLFELTDGQLFVAAFLLMAANGFASFPSSELIWAVIGGACASGDRPLLLIITAGVLGNVVGTTLLYAIARAWGRKVVKRFVLLNAPFADRLLAEVDDIFVRRGPIVVSTCRCVPVLRSVISVPAGIAQMNVATFLCFTAVGCAIWGLAWFSIGYALGHRALTMMSDYRPEIIIVNIVLILIVAVVVWRKVANRIFSIKTNGDE